MTSIDEEEDGTSESSSVSLVPCLVKKYEERESQRNPKVWEGLSHPIYIRPY